jgi:hypothetical protein
MRLLTQFFILSPHAFLINDAILLQTIQAGTYDPVVVSLMIIYVLSRDPSIVDPPLVPSERSTPPLSTSNDNTFPSFTPKYAKVEEADTFAYSVPYEDSEEPPTTVDPSLLSRVTTPLDFEIKMEVDPTHPSLGESINQRAIEPYLNFVEEALFSRLAESGP